jgi:hypothetical protein
MSNGFQKKEAHSLAVIAANAKRTLPVFVSNGICAKTVSKKYRVLREITKTTALQQCFHCV